jgi:hypothetical protein
MYDQEKATHPHKPSTKTDQKRRKLLQLLGLSLPLTGSAASLRYEPDVADRILDLATQLSDKLELTIMRPEDLLELNMTYVGYKLSADRKFLQKSSEPGVLIVEFSSQSLAEEAFEERPASGEFAPAPPNGAMFNGNNASPRYPARTLLSGESRLVFSIPSSISRIAMTAEALLDWDRFKPLVSKRAASPKVPPAFTMDDINAGVFVPNLQGQLPTRVPALKNPSILSGGNDKPQNPAQRQAEVNRNLRGATRIEQRQISRNEAPPGATTSPDTAAIIRAVSVLANGKTPRPVDAMETCIEMPFRLQISPNEFAAWYHEHRLKWKPSTEGSLSTTVELWHTRLTCKTCTGGKDLSDALKSIRSVRALWGHDINGDFRQKPQRDDSFKTSLYNDDRHAIVHESSNWALPGGFIPKPVMVDNLMLSSLGGWLDAEMTVPVRELESSGLTGSLNLLKWKHLSTLARDHYVEIVYAGHIMPFGHEASLVRITERRPQQGYAVNRQRYFLAITEEEKKFDTHDPRTGTFNAFNFSTVRFITTASPTLDPPVAFCSDINPRQPDRQFMPRVNGKPYPFRILAFDLDGNEVDFELPVVFVSSDVTRLPNGSVNAAQVRKLNECYNRLDPANKRASLRNQRMAVARSHTPDDTVMEVASIIFESMIGMDGITPVRPTFKQLDVFVGAVEQITGKRAPVSIELVDDEINKAVNAVRNKGKVYARLIEKVEASFSGAGMKTGGALSPDFAITALSKTLGAIGGDVEDAMNARFNPEKYFGQAGKLFGIIDLSRIIRTVQNVNQMMQGDDLISAFPALRQFTNKEGLVSQYVWKAATLKEHDFGFVKFKPKRNTPGSLKIDTRLYRWKDPSRSNVVSVNASIDDFSVEIASLAAVRFKRVGFVADTNLKTDFTVDMEAEPLKFLGALTFVNDLQRFIPADGFSDPPYLDITPGGITSGYTLALPDIQLGVFTLRNISLGASVRLPFDGSPMALRFNFCEKQQPFTLTVSALGGGGFFSIEFDMKGLRSLEAALEFGAAVSLELGVASGAVSVMGGIYFRMVTTDGVNDYVLEGYLRINGALSVLGLITVSVEFMMNLVAVMENDKVTKVWGEARLRVKVEVFLFSKTVTLHVQREFAGAGADPTFAMLISDDEWQQYCEAFAA